MSKLFNDYPEISSGTLEASDLTAESTENMKKFQKRMKKNNKLIKRLVELQELNITQEQRMIKYENKNENIFFHKLGDVVLKAIPSILISITPMLFASWFGKKNK